MYDHHEVKRQVFLIESKTIGLDYGLALLACKLTVQFIK